MGLFLANIGRFCMGKKRNVPYYDLHFILKVIHFKYNFEQVIFYLKIIVNVHKNNL